MNSLVQKKDWNKKQKSQNCTVTELNFPCENVELAFADITGRYPESGWVVNEIITEIFHVLRGEGVTYTNNTR